MIGSRLTLALWACSGLLAAEDPVKIESGLLSGVEEDGIRIYRGIPYAAPPVGELRWRPPQPALKWDSVRAATEFGAVCVQPVRGKPGTFAGDEDCLTLNVWTPAKKPDEGLAVMVRIHGGGFTSGSGSGHDGRRLAAEDLVVVTVNYRLGVFGLFAHPALAREQPGKLLGNYHLMDQMAALRWVQRNIRGFGGDPGRVTVFGESAGGGSVLCLVSSPEARGLFQGAIVESGGGRGNGRTLAEWEEIYRQPVRELGAHEGPDSLRTLRAMPAEQLVEHVATARGTEPTERIRLRPAPAVDGKILAASPTKVFQEGGQLAVPLIIGANSYEGSATASMGADEVLAPLGRQLESAERIYEPETSGDRDLLAAKVYGDRSYVGPARFYAGQMERVRQPAWLYHFSYVLEKFRGLVPGAAHGWEVPFVFQNFVQYEPLIRSLWSKLAPPTTPTPENLVTDSDLRLAAKMAGYWIRFAKTGNPNPPGKVEWPSYDRKTDQLLEFGEEIVVRTNFRKEQLDFIDKLWREQPRETEQ